MTNSAQLHGIKFQPMLKRFMVWRTQDKCWATWYERHIVKIMDINQLAEFLADWNATKGEGEKNGDGLIICQSTNLFDKDGKEIFEGSIVKIVEDNGATAYAFHKNARSVVRCYDDVACFGIQLGDKRCAILGKYLKVVGHILSNQELLEGKQND